MPRAKRTADAADQAAPKRPRKRKAAAEVSAPPPPQHPHVAAALEYARGVVSKEIPAGKYVILAAKRHLRDLELAAAGNSPYHFDNAAAEVVCNFIELMPHVKGKWAKQNETIKLGPWQCFLLCVAFGWKRAADGLRRFREIYWEIPRKNGKSVLGAGIGNYMFIGDGEYGAEVYSGATSEKQAWEVFGPAKQMLEKSPDICEDASVEVNAKSLFRTSDNSKFLPVIGKPGDGSSPHCAIIDEYHEHLTSDQYDTMATGMGAREQPMIVIITTAGTSMAGPCRDKHLQARKVLEGVAENDELFAVIYGIDEAESEGEKGDDWADPNSLRKANPNYGVSVGADYLLSQQRQAVLNAENQNRFRTKHLNQWCSSKSSWMNMALYDACENRALDEKQFVGDSCLLVLDLASKNDICEKLKLFSRMAGGLRHYYVFAKHYLPEKSIESDRTNKGLYEKWVNEGHLTATDGSEIDFDFIGEEVRRDAERNKVDEILYDKWRAVQLAQQLTKDGATCIEYPQTVATMSLPMKELMAAVRAGRFHHNGDPVLKWMFSNVVAKTDAKDNIYPRKEKDELKIDGAVACIMGVGRAMTMADNNAGFDNWIKSQPVTA